MMPFRALPFPHGEFACCLRTHTVRITTSSEPPL